MQMESSEVSVHQFRVFQSVKSAGSWLTVKEIAEKANVARRTAAQHAFRFVNAGIFEQAEVFPAHRYKFSSLASKRDKAFMARMERAAVIFGSAAAQP
jgi:predicted transcriptional regulator